MGGWGAQFENMCAIGGREALPPPAPVARGRTKQKIRATRPIITSYTDLLTNECPIGASHAAKMASNINGKRRPGSRASQNFKQRVDSESTLFTKK